MIIILKFHLLWAQHRMKHEADKHRSDRSFEIGNLVIVKLQPYRQKSVVLRESLKLSPKFYGPYKILDKMGSVAYKLELPNSSRIHPVFHVLQLKRVIGTATSTTQLPTILTDTVIKVPKTCLGRKFVKRQNRAATMILVKWRDESKDTATWEFLYDLQKKFPDFSP